MRRVSALIAVALALSMSACASMKLDLRSARLVYAVPTNPYGPHENDRPQVFLRVEFRTSFDFREHGETTGFLVPCGNPRNHLGAPLNPTGDYGASLISPEYDAPHPPGQVFTADFTSIHYFFSVTPSDAAPVDGIWKVSFVDAVKAQGLCFYVLSGGTIFNSPTSPDIRVDEIMLRSMGPQPLDKLNK